MVVGLLLVTGMSTYAQSDASKAWFGGIGGGMNFSFDGQKESREISHNGAGTALDVYIGKWFNSFAGFRIGYQGLGTSNQFVDYGKYRFDYIHGDVLFGVKDWFIPYIHAGYAHVETGGATAGVGLMMPIHLTKRLAIVPDVKTMLHTNRIFPEGRRSTAGTLSGTLGIVVNIGSRPKPQKPVYIPIENTRIQTDTIVIEKTRVDTVYIRDVPKKEREINDALNSIVLFDFDSYSLTSEARPVLDDVAKWLRENDDISVVVEGHTDSIGSEAYNQVLSERRAEAVVRYLSDRGVRSRNLRAVGYGKTRPAMENDTAEHRHQNRRIEFRLTER